MRARLQAAALVAAMALGSLALWIAIPAGWLWLTREMSAGARFVLTVPACAVTMFAAGWLLYRLQEIHGGIAGTQEETRAHPSWMRSPTEERRPRRPLSLLADNPSPSGPLQPL